MKLDRDVLAAWLVGGCVVLSAPRVDAAEQLVFSGAYTFVIPEVLSDKMTALAGAQDWVHFPELARRIDVDDDGVDDFIAIGLGAPGGAGAQVRYRLAGDATQRLGAWYWCVLTDERGDQVFEAYNR